MNPHKIAHFLFLLFAWLTGPWAPAAGKPIDLTSGGNGSFQVGLGREFPGATGNAWVASLKDEGILVVRLVGDFRGGGAYVALVKSPDEPVMANGLLLTVRSGEIMALVVRTTDSTGQTFQQKIVLDDTRHWQLVKVDDLTGKKNGGNSWGGAKDGAWHGPLKTLALLIDKGTLKTTGEKLGLLEIKDISWQ